MLMPIHFSLTPPHLFSVCYLIFFSLAQPPPPFCARLVDERFYSRVPPPLNKSAVEAPESWLEDSRSGVGRGGRGGTPVQHSHTGPCCLSLQAAMCARLDLWSATQTSPLHWKAVCVCLRMLRIISLASSRGAATLACGGESFFFTPPPPLHVVLQPPAAAAAAWETSALSLRISSVPRHGHMMRQPSSTSPRLHGNRAGHSIPEQMWEG